MERSKYQVDAVEPLAHQIRYHRHHPLVRIAWPALTSVLALSPGVGREVRVEPYKKGQSRKIGRASGPPLV